ncbi:hypothetical protein IWW50_001582 [Coemansia erecta]|nr:hypothetical protein GGF43_000343 [Coemansia sp. RSA 2618]KAJ2828048.1 hypothetical protein IWW50_001582 [Coemansia erecta]
MALTEEIKDTGQEEPLAREQALEDDMAQNSVSLDIVWKGNTRYPVRVPKYATVMSIKVLLEELTKVDAGSQKLLGLVRGKLPQNSDTLEELCVASGTRVRLIGTRVADQLQSRGLWQEEPDASVPVIRDYDGDCEEGEGDEGDGVSTKGKWAGGTLVSNVQKKLVRVQSNASIQMINAPRVGRKLVVLDLDYTLLDCKQRTGDVVGMARPGLHEFLAAIYPHYDLIVWSQTRWPALECKITLMGMLTHPMYRITTALDSSTMFSVRVLRDDGVELTHHVKPLELIWSRFPGVYSRSNTVHVDDLERNFALNRQNGLKIRRYRRASSRAQRDTELMKLTRYLLLIAQLPSFEHLNHAQWQDYR